MKFLPHGKAGVNKIFIALNSEPYCSLSFVLLFHGYLLPFTSYIICMCAHEKNLSPVKTRIVFYLPFITFGI